MVRKSSSKKLVKQIEEKTKQTPDVLETAICTGQDALLLPLDTTKENLKELCSKSRSPSPLEIAAESPILAQLRILQKDSKTSKTCGNDNDDDNMSTPAGIVTGKSRVMAAVPLNTTATTSGVPLNTTATTSGVPQHTAATTSGSSTGGAVDTTPEVDIVKGVADRQRTSTTTWSQTTYQTMADNANCSNNNYYRRTSDVSYTFSNFRTSPADSSSSNFLGQELRDLQTMMLGDHRSEALQQDSSAGNPGSSLHKLLLNRQHLTAADADRKPKFKFSSMNRDVPTGSPPPVSNLLYYMTAAAAAATSLSSCRSAPHSKRASPEHECTSAREMLLKLFYGGSDTVAEPNLST
ncbi:unnamed protein product [Macrosiphum euphorbiae]|uniref:Uncharacterized protein n=1 Tax=Macrosiphum euphorbiae TaxID=13131 RepID=A0AAV0VMS9_9HEMI|nr:unnamed protein product [Macrosiphum euphorbiae]